MSASRPGPNETDPPLSAEEEEELFARPVIDEPDFEDESDPESRLSPGTLDALADEAAERHYDR